MTSLRQRLRHRAGSILPLGAMASLLSMAALALRGHAEAGSAAAPFNAVSHRLRPGRALRLDTAHPRHTALGAAVHAGSSVFWAAVYDEAVCRRQPPPSPAGLMAGAAGVAALAAVADLALVPAHSAPGDAHRLSQRGRALTYALFAAGLAAGGLAARRWR
ncbi:hypothetical protein [Ideonella sp.]|uniref:hypothetical protein n=1 Tax=Ideonella sp. TaxID=1929293 RepID=UPI0035B45EFD